MLGVNKRQDVLPAKFMIESVMKARKMFSVIRRREHSQDGGGAKAEADGSKRVDDKPIVGFATRQHVSLPPSLRKTVQTQPALAVILGPDSRCLDHGGLCAF